MIDSHLIMWSILKINQKIHLGTLEWPQKIKVRTEKSTLDWSQLFCCGSHDICNGEKWYTQSKCTWFWWIFLRIVAYFSNLPWKFHRKHCIKWATFGNCIRIESCDALLINDTVCCFFGRCRINDLRFICVFLRFCIYHQLISINYLANCPIHLQDQNIHKQSYVEWFRFSFELKQTNEICREFACLILITSFSLSFHPCRDNGTSIQAKTRTI